MIEVKEDTVVFLGDNVTARRIPRMSDGNFRGNIETVERILQTGASPQSTAARFLPARNNFV